MKKPLRYIKKTAGFVWKSSPTLTIINIFLSIFQGILPLLFIYLMKLLVDEISGAMSNADKDAAFREILFIY